MTPQPWPASREFVEVIQNPSVCFTHPELKASTPAVDKLWIAARGIRPVCLRVQAEFHDRDPRSGRKVFSQLYS